MKKIKRCKSCGQYTLHLQCNSCGERVTIPHPPKFSPEDKYGKYRRILKRRGAR